MTEFVFPQNRNLSGVDNFFLAMEHSVQEISGRSNICRIVIDLPEKVKLPDFKKKCQDAALIVWLTSLRVSPGFPFQIPQWYCYRGDEEVCVVEHVTDELIPQELLTQRINVFKKPLIRFDLLQRSSGKSTIIFSWSHVLMDAHGAETLLKHFSDCVKVENKEDFFPSDQVSTEKFIDKLNRSKVIKNYLNDKELSPFVNVIEDKKQFKSSVVYKNMVFSEDETKLIDANSSRSPAKFLKSLFFLSAVTRAYDELLKVKKIPRGNFLVPVPQDGRKRGSKAPVISNAVNFLFFKIPQKVMVDRDSTIEELVHQMKEMMKIELQKKYSDFMDICRRLPLFIYNKILNSASEGNMASFIFSDTGNSLNDFNEFMGQEVQRIFHYPPNTCPPGFTIVFSRHKNALNVTLSYMKDMMAEGEVDIFENQLRKDLLTQSPQ